MSKSPEALHHRSITRYGVTAHRAGDDTVLSNRALLSEPVDMAVGRAEQLHALLTMTRGEGFEYFTRLDKPLQEALLTLASGLALEVQLLSELQSAPRTGEACHV
ncbi:hypothetical protein [Cupriavidus sp. D39]|uniref:hypothetical protein n=1 Tax=Cupriavidus sp. D39 TaxID=2997877 RepID=UPI0022716B70|nr:hypothetical protein [Cupriavidus sp. D39]MCY0858085.1 hypothetical protein [Cupriavidus sp. D39]